MGLGHSPSIVLNGLVLCLDAGNTKSYPGTGTAWTDLSGRGNTGTLTNGPTYSSANGGAIVFDGTNDYVTLGTPPILNGVRVPLTIIGWAKANSFASGGVSSRIIYSVYGYTGNFNSRLYSMIRVDFGVLKYFTSDSGSGVQSVGTFTPSLNVWNFYAVVVSGTLSSPTVQIFLNNSSESFSLGALTATPALDVDFRIGGAESNFNEYWNGNISQVSIYNRALSAAEISQNFNALRGRFSV